MLIHFIPSDMIMLGLSSLKRKHNIFNRMLIRLHSFGYKFFSCIVKNYSVTT